MMLGAFSMSLAVKLSASWTLVPGLVPGPGMR